MLDLLIAQESSVQVALFIENVAFWINVNHSQGQNYKEGRYWTYNTQESLIKYFSYWTPDELRTVIKNAIKFGFLITGSFNKKGYDRTKWYTLSDKALDYFPIIKAFKPPVSLIWENSQMELGNLPNGVGRFPGAIPDIIPVIKPVKKDTGITEPVSGIFSLSVKEKEEILLLKNEFMADCGKSDSLFIMECEEHLKKRVLKDPGKHRNKLLKGLKTLITENIFNKKFKSNAQRAEEDKKIIDREVRAQEEKEIEIEASKIYPKLVKEAAQRTAAVKEFNISQLNSILGRNKEKSE